MKTEKRGCLLMFAIGTLTLVAITAYLTLAPEPAPPPASAGQSRSREENLVVADFDCRDPREDCPYEGNAVDDPR